MRYFLTKANLLPLLILVLSACNDDDSNGVRGSGPTVTRPLDLPAVRGLDVSGAMNVVIAQGETQEVTVEGQENLIDLLSTDVNGGVWDVRFTRSVRNLDNFTVFITVVDLDLLELSGASDVVSEGNLELDELEIVSSGASDISLRGRVGRQTLDLSGASDINNFDFVSEETIVDVSGAADVEVTATELLDARVSGSGTVVYRGNPDTVTTDISGAGEVIAG